MKKIAVLFFAISLLFNIKAQDTTWVKTFTFDSITTRRANFVFPPELNDKRFEKVLMYYKLKCSPLTTWDQYNCGEWDYLTYTRVFDHTGIMDSVRKDGNQYLANWLSPNTIRFSTANNYFDSWQQKEYFRTGSSTYSNFVNTASGDSNLPFSTNSKGSHFQFLIKASDLLNAGITQGELQSLFLDVVDLGTNGELMHPHISLKSTADSTLTAFHSVGFSNVYNASRGVGGTNSALTIGPNEFLFHQPFLWDGSNNLIVDFYYENDKQVANPLIFKTVQNTDSTGLLYKGKNGTIEFDGTNYALMELSDLSIGNEMTIEFWMKGDGNTSTNTSFLEAYDTLGNRIVNIHFPWSDNNLYFDAGQSSGYDRINKTLTATDIDNNWNHWSFVKKQSTGEMFIYKNGQLWHSGTGKNNPVGYMHRMVLGASANQSYKWKGNVEELRIFSSALTPATINANYKKGIDASHPNWSDLLVSYNFDNDNIAVDSSPNQYKLMPSQLGMIQTEKNPVAGFQQSTLKPVVGFGQGNIASSLDSNTVQLFKKKEPTIIFKQEAVNRHFEIAQTYAGVLEGYETNYDLQNQVISQTAFSADTQLNNTQVTYYEKPFELVNDVEIARYITPYGIQFDLGPNGFAWIYDVTDYQQYLRDTVDLAAHNTQELLDLRFAFIEGIPPRDLIKRQPIWSDFRSYNFTNMASNIELPATNVVLDSTAEMFKIKTRMSGHGQVGDNACCEWVANDHQIKVDGVSRFNWNIWQDKECGENPNIGQGGTWPYAREGWCPGDRVKEHEFELTPFVQAGDTVSLDYVINPVPTNDQGQGGGNYIAAFDLISYGKYNFQNDAAIADVLNPNNWEYYSKWNPTCSNPRVILQNTGQLPLTSCKIYCWITEGNNIEIDWTGNLGFLEDTMIEIPVANYDFWTDYNSTKTFTAGVKDVNGIVGEDEYPQNSRKSTKFDAAERIDGPFFVWLTTNNKANENRYRLIDHAGTVIFERNQLDNQTQYKDTFDLQPGCYSIIVEDSDNDGLAFWYSSQVEGETSGNMKIRKVGGSYIEFFPSDFGSYHRYDFSVGFTLGLNEMELAHTISIFPNPSNGMTTIEVEGAVNNDASLEIYDVMGRKVWAEKMNATSSFAESFVDVSDFNSGMYVVKITTNQRVYTKELLKQ